MDDGREDGGRAEAGFEGPRFSRVELEDGAIAGDWTAETGRDLFWADVSSDGRTSTVWSREGVRDGEGRARCPAFVGFWDGFRLCWRWC